MTGPEVVFPALPVPAFVAERFPGFDPTDPSTWPEPDRCTDGRPWGLSTYEPSGVLGSNVDYRWQQYLDAVDAGKRPYGACRNRWRDERYRMCGTHLNPYLDAVFRAERRKRAEASRLRHVELAKRLDEYGIVADGHATGVLLQADAVEGVLRLLDPLHGAGL